MSKKIKLFLIFSLMEVIAFSQSQGGYHDAMMEEKSGSGGGIWIGLIIIVAILYFTQDKNKS